MMKKAQELSLITLIGLILVALVLLVALARIYQYGADDKYEKRFLGEDIRLFIYTLQASPNDLIIKYPQDTYGYTYDFSSEHIEIYKQEDKALSSEFMLVPEPKLAVEEVVINTENEGNIEIVGGMKGIPIIFIKTKDSIIPVKGFLIGDKNA